MHGFIQSAIKYSHHFVISALAKLVDYQIYQFTITTGLVAVDTVACMVSTKAAHFSLILAIGQTRGCD